jgi:hypothetical protein
MTPPESFRGWIQALEVFNADSGQLETRTLFPADRAQTAAPPLSRRLEQYRFSRRRQNGDCWLERERTDWARLSQVLVAYRWIEPGSEWRCHQLWDDRSALGDLLGEEFHWDGRDQLDAVLDRLVGHRRDHRDDCRQAVVGVESVHAARHSGGARKPSPQYRKLG